MGNDSHAHVHGENILITIVLNILITTAQIIGGIISGSTALLSDAAHNFSDVLSLIITFIAEKLSHREQTLKQTYGFKRAGIFAALLNTVALLIVAVLLIREALPRIVNPEPVKGLIVIYLAAAGILLNGLSLLFIKKEAKENMNIRSAYFHLFMDMLTSVAVLIGGVLIKYLGWYSIDGILTVIIALYLIYSSWGLFYDAIKIFMQFTPAGIDIKEIAEKITSLSGIKNIHHVHVWQLDDSEMILEAHVDLDKDYTISEFEDILRKIEEILEQYRIFHFNIQPELLRNDRKDLIN